jgi:transcriptional regulator with XRE-family HTH domain
MNIGEKIKQIRTDKNLSQENVYPSNQSLVSQIEKGVNKNPTEQTLRIMAQQMGLSFEELIEGTEWELPRNVSKKSEYAFSQTECIVKVEDSGVIKTLMKSYPLVEDTGEENKFDADTGYKLLTECKSCKRNIHQNNQKYCLGCGKKLFNNYSFTERIFSTDSITDSIKYTPGDKPTDEVFETNEEGKLILHNIHGSASAHAINSEYTNDIDKNKEVINNLSKLLAELMDIEKVISFSAGLKEGIKINETIDSILADQVIGTKYYFYFRKYYWMMTNMQVLTSRIVGLDSELHEKVIEGGPEKDEISYFHPFNRIPFGLLEGWPASIDGKPLALEDEKKQYEDGFFLHELVNINPNDIKNKIIEDWWIMFQYDLSMTKGLLSEMQRHLNRLIIERDEWSEKNNEKG